MGFRFGFQLERLGEEGGATLAQALTEVVDQSGGDVVLIVDEVQQAVSSEEGNPRPGTPARRNQAFAGATSLPYPLLDQAYVRHVLDRLREEGMDALPTVEAAWRAFQILGHRPEEFLRALGQLRAHASSGLATDQLLPVIATTLRSSAADLELAKVEQIGGLATAIFDRVACSDGPARGIFSAEAAAAYGEAIGREVRVEEIQPVVNELLAANVLMRVGHGLYGVSDPFVQEMWRERKG
jgi:hypothetical protein